MRLNGDIVSAEVRLIDMQGQQVGVMALEKAQTYAEQAGMDLVEIAPDAKPPVCRIMDYGKHLFEQNKKRHQARRRQKHIHVKEVKFRPGTDKNDYGVKLRNLIRFLEKGDKTKVTLRFRGREMLHQDLGVKMLDKIEQDLSEYAVVEQEPKLEGRQIVMILKPKK